MGFGNPAVGGSTLIRDSIHSPNYVTGVSGWSIMRNGDAEFNQGRFRGAVLIGGPPAVGAVSLGLTGTDIPAVLRNFNAEYDIWYEANIYWYSATDFYFEALVHNTFFALTERITGTVHGGGTVVEIQEFVDGPTGAANAVHLGTDRYVVNRLLYEIRSTDIQIRSTGTFTTEADLKSADPVAGLPTVETWHNLGFLNGWGGALKYRMIPSPANNVQIVGVITAGTKVNGTTIATLPAAYRPTTAQDVPGNADVTVAGATNPHFNVLANGNINCFGYAAATNCSICGLIALDF